MESSSPAPRVSESSATPLPELFLSGALAGFVTDLTLHPLDTIKNRLQTSSSSSSTSSSSSMKNSSNKTKVGVDLQRLTLRNLYRGVKPALLCSGPSGAAYLGVYTSCNEKLNSLSSSSSSSNSTTIKTTTSLLLRNSWIAAIAGEAAACCVRAPFEILKVNQQIGLSSQESWGKLSFTSFQRVYFALLAREFPFSAIQLPLLEFIRHSILVNQRISEEEEEEEEEDLTKKEKSSTTSSTAGTKRVVATCAAGFLAGGVSAFITTPMDVARAKIAVSPVLHAVLSSSSSSSSASVSSKSLPPPSWWQVLPMVVKQDGIKGCFRGASYRVAMISCGGTIFFGSFELARSFFVPS